jgi:hypothetical protein
VTAWSVTVRALVRPRCLFTARRYGMQPVRIHWISHTVMFTQQHCVSRPSRVFDSPASSAASACVPLIARVPEGPRQPYTVDAFASTGVGFL